MLAEINEVYHRYGRYPTQCGYRASGPRPQEIRVPFRGGQGGQRPYTPRHNTPRHQNTTVANQAYTFNGTTPHVSVNYVPGSFQHGNTILHTSPGTIWIPIKPTTSTTLATEGQLVCTRPKQQCNTNRYNNATRSA